MTVKILNDKGFTQKEAFQKMEASFSFNIYFTYHLAVFKKTIVKTPYFINPAKCCTVRTNWLT